jgi:hypothetical protein
MTSPRSRRSERSASARNASARRRTNARPSAAPKAALALLAALILVVAAGCGDDDGGDADGGSDAAADRFDHERALASVDEQVAVGQRPAGSPQLRELAEQLRSQLPNGELEPFGDGLQNVVGILPGSEPAIVVGAHYDTEAHPPGFVGANDGAAGTAGVIEVAQALERELPEEHREVRFVLFDGEEEPPGCPDAQFQQCALRGSKAYVAAHQEEVGEMILLDYIANEGLQIPQEGNSDPALWKRLREAAAEVGAEDRFPGGVGAAILDDHIPFLLAGIPSIDLIDFNYEHADTVEDTPDKLEADALDDVGETVTQLVLNEAQP